MRALGKAGFPEAILVGGREYRLAKPVKHDFFAATAFYDDPAGGRVVLKLSRTEDFAGIPLLWLGRWLCQREQKFYARLTDLPSVPKVLGAIGETGFVLEFVDGRPLSEGGPVPDGFFRRLQALMIELHRRDIAYVDTNKMQNILVGRDGKPHLVDFQISFDARGAGPAWLRRRIMAHLQGSDAYHVLKHKRRLRPDEMSAQEMRDSQRRSFGLRLHRIVFKPYFKLRRRTFQRLRATGRLLPEGSK